MMLYDKILAYEKYEFKLPRDACPMNWNTCEKANFEKMHEVIGDNFTIIDVGAERGSMTALLAKWAGEK